MTGPDALLAGLQDHLARSVVRPVRERIDAYREALERALATMDGIAAGAAAEPDETEEARSAARLRLRYADRFLARFGDDLFAEADRARALLIEELKAIPERVPALPETLPTPEKATAPEAPELVRPDWRQRVISAVSRGETTEVPVAALAELYMGELARRLEPVAGDAARLTSVAVARIRWQLHAHTELGRDDENEPPGLDEAVDGVLAELDAVIAAVQVEFDTAVRAAAVRIPEGRAENAREQVLSHLDRTVDDWAAFERTLVANVGAEAVLARALASIEAAAARTARRIEGVRDRYGAAPLDRLADGLVAMGERADEALDGDTAALEAMAEEAERLFRENMPRVDDLESHLEGEVEGLVSELASIPTQVPEDLQISEKPIPGIPDRPRKLSLRDAPLEELLNTACGGTLPRLLEKSLVNAREEMNALGHELGRVRNAVAFQLRAPLRGGFDPKETRRLVAGITDRAAAQIEDLRAQGLSAIDTLVAGLEERAGDETESLRSAVANREFMRIHSEIAEEQAVRQISSGLERVRDVAGSAGRGVRGAWGLGERAITAVQDWAQRQLGVGEVEREVMLESLEQSLIGEDKQGVQLPALYRQLFDVESDVPWAELLVPRDEELAVVQRAYDRWVEDRSATLAIVGEKGSGKTTLLRLAEENVFDESRVVRATLGRSVDDPAELRSRLARAFEIEDTPAMADAINRQPPAVAIVEDLHHLFIRALGGFEAMEAFLEIIAATRANVLWVVTVDEFAWRYLNRVVGIEAHFVHTVNTTELSPGKLEQAIMARHDVSGFALRFETEGREPTDGRWARLLGREARGELTRKESQRRLYFEELAEIAEGNIVLALFYWLRSIRRMEEHVLVLGDPEIIDLEFLDRLPLAHLHTIAAIILHGGLSETAHQRVFQLPPVESRLQLAALADSHIIFLARDGEYKINKVLYRPFIRLLTSKNIF